MITTAAQAILKGNGTMQSAAGTPDALWTLLETFRPELLIQSQAIVGSRDDAEDVVQETFIEVSQNPQKLPKSGVGAWLKAINRRNSVDRLRVKGSDSRRIQNKSLQAPEDLFTTGGFSQLELKESLESALQTLPENLKRIVRLRYFEQLSYKDISIRMKVPIGTVNWMLIDAFAALFARLKDQIPAGKPGLRDDSETQGNAPVQDKHK